MGDFILRFVIATTLLILVDAIGNRVFGLRVAGEACGVTLGGYLIANAKHNLIHAVSGLIKKYLPDILRVLWAVCPPVVVFVSAAWVAIRIFGYEWPGIPIVMATEVLCLLWLFKRLGRGR